MQPEVRRGVAVTPMETRRDVIVQMAVLADELGYEVFSVPEGWGLDSTLVLTEIALRTRRIKLVSGILSVWGRTPATLAMTAATLYDLSGGRFILGLGPSTRALVEGFHGRAFSDPAQQLLDTTRRVRGLVSGAPAQLENVPGARAIRLGQPAAPDLPIWLAATGRRTTRVAAELADGWFPLYATRERIRTWMDELAPVRAAAGQRGAPLTVAAGPTIAVDGDARVARQIVAANTAWYLCAMGDIYSRLVSAQGYAGAVAAIRAANPRPSPASAVVPDEAEVILDEFAVYGTPSQVRDRLSSWDGAVDIVMIGCPSGLPWESLAAAVRAAAP
jgi:alkanesulfonate monooxygenase SsuD/methylene tetrahydromethanopterin reductase-like flavin-dependent oxidoreductase (luciferase family)